MNTTSILDGLETDNHEHQEAQPEKPLQIADEVRSFLQTSLAGEAQNFRSWVAAAHRKFKDLQRLALALTALTCVLSSSMMFASLWQARHITSQAASQLQFLQQEAAVYPNAFADLSRQNWAPTGKLITQKGRTFIELKAVK